jgi:hypothetical protein
MREAGSWKSEREGLVGLIQHDLSLDKLHTQTPYDDPDQSTYSYTPISHAPSFPSGRGNPRWSVVMPLIWQFASGIASIAGLFGARA